MDLADAIRNAKRTYIIGNGGSYANAVHICNDLLACGVRAYTLDPATLTASANDHGFDTVFARWLSVVGEHGDLLLVLSGSGQSQNIVQALHMAKRIGMATWALVGNFDNLGVAATLADHATLYGKGMQSAEAAQIVTGHEVMRCLKNS